MNKKVYLAGPMVGLSKEEMCGWRTQLRDYLAISGIEVLDPTRRIPFGGLGYDSINYANYIFQSDLRDIQQSDAVFFDVRESSGKGAGTQMEIMYSWMLQKKMYLWRNELDFSHPFYTGMMAEINSSMFTLAARMSKHLVEETRWEEIIAR